MQFTDPRRLRSRTVRGGGEAISISTPPKRHVVAAPRGPPPARPPSPRRAKAVVLLGRAHRDARRARPTRAAADLDDGFKEALGGHTTGRSLCRAATPLDVVDPVGDALGVLVVVPPRAGAEPTRAVGKVREGEGEARLQLRVATRAVERPAVVPRVAHPHAPSGTPRAPQPLQARLQPGSAPASRRRRTRDAAPQPRRSSAARSRTKRCRNSSGPRDDPAFSRPGTHRPTLDGGGAEDAVSWPSAV